MSALEVQLESEHEERTHLVREKHELERQLLSFAQQAAQAVDDEVVLKLKRDLKRTKALLKDAHTQMERLRSETPSKVLLRQLKNQVQFQSFLLEMDCFSLTFVYHCSSKTRSLLVLLPLKVASTLNRSWLSFRISWRKR